MQAHTVINRNDVIKKENLAFAFVARMEPGTFQEKLQLNFMNLGSNGTLKTPFMYWATNKCASTVAG